MSHTYIGLTPRFLSTGRPIVFGDLLEDAELALADELTKSLIVEQAAPATLPAPTDNPESEAR